MLLQRHLDGDSEAFGALMRHHEQELMAFLTRFICEVSPEFPNSIERVGQRICQPKPPRHISTPPEPRPVRVVRDEREAPDGGREIRRT